jgi:hypothetical protein
VLLREDRSCREDRCDPVLWSRCHSHSTHASVRNIPGCCSQPWQVMANILRGPLLELAPRLAGYAEHGSGRLLLSGILAEQVHACC